MLIGIDGNEANVEKKVGVSVYTHELLKHFQKQASKNIQFLIYLRVPPNQDMPIQTKYYKYKVVKASRMWRDIFLPVSLYFDEKPDVFFSPAHYTPRFSPIPVVVTIHDLAHVHFPNEFLKKDIYKLTNWTKHAMKHAKKVIAVSQTTKNDIVEHYGIPDDHVTVIHNGFRKLEDEDKYASLFSVPKGPFILYVGTIQPRKNIVQLIHAYKHVLKDNPHLKLVIVGKKGWLYGDTFDAVVELELENNVIFTGYVSNQQLSKLYKKAICSVFPSLYEGFGLPILEAMVHECPVIASNNSSFPEIGGNACLYIDPHDTIELKDAIQRVIGDKKLQKSMIEKGTKRIKQFSWEKCAKETLAVLKNT